MEYFEPHLLDGEHDRLYISNRVVNRCKQKIQWWNSRVSVANIGRFLSSINSYLGRMKQPGVFAYGVIRNLVARVSERWFKYVHFNDERRCFQANQGYGHNLILANKYHFKIKTV